MKAPCLWLALLACLMVKKACGKIFSRCELASKLKRWGMDGYEGYSLEDWVCLAYFASHFDTTRVTRNSDGISEYGIFQINSRSWCVDKFSNSKNLCSISCLDFVTNEDIIDDIICTKRAAAGPEGLGAWLGKFGIFSCSLCSQHTEETCCIKDDFKLPDRYVWRNHCRGRDLRYWTIGCKL